MLMTLISILLLVLGAILFGILSVRRKIKWLKQNKEIAKEISVEFAWGIGDMILVLFLLILIGVLPLIWFSGR